MEAGAVGEAILQQMTVVQLVKTFLHFMEPEVSLPCSQEGRRLLAQHWPTTSKTQINIIFPFTAMSPKWHLLFMTCDCN